MVYEYEESNKQIVFTVDNESSMDKLNERIKELQEVYSKAKSFDKIFNAVNAPYVEYPEDWMVDVLKVVRNFEQEDNDEI